MAWMFMRGCKKAPSHASASTRTYPHALASKYIMVWSNYCTGKTMVARLRQQAVRALIVLFDEFTE